MTSENLHPLVPFFQPADSNTNNRRCRHYIINAPIAPNIHSSGERSSAQSLHLMPLAPNPSSSGHIGELRAKHPTFVHPFSHFNSYATHSSLFFILTTYQMREIQHNIHPRHNQFLRNSWYNEAWPIIHSNTNSVTSENYVQRSHCT
jgi:hypothetical protein